VAAGKNILETPRVNFRGKEGPDLMILYIEMRQRGSGWHKRRQGEHWVHVHPQGD